MIHSTNSVTCVLTILMIVYCLSCLTRVFVPLRDDRNFYCKGYPYDTRLVQRKRSSNNKYYWYVSYCMNYTTTTSLSAQCHKYDHVRYTSSHKYKCLEDAFNASFSMKNVEITKSYPTKTRELLNLISFIVGIFLSCVWILSCHENRKNNSYYIERHRLLK